MTQDSIRAFVDENFGRNYFPVYHGQTNIVTPLALIVKQKRKWWKRPFGKGEMIILGGLESYIVDEEHFYSSTESKLVRECKIMEKTETGEVSRYMFYARGGGGVARDAFRIERSVLLPLMMFSLNMSKAAASVVALIIKQKI